MRPCAGSLLVVLAALAALPACSDQAPLNAPLPPAGILTGQFGGRLIEITAADTATQFRFPCGTGKTTPLQVNIEGVLEASGSASPYWPPNISQPMHTTAQLRGNMLDVSVTIGTGSTGTTQVYLLRRDAPGDFSGIACAAG